ncbi:MAG TPA: DUF2585 family protein, partial [Planctomycetaceae bacterium]
MTASTSTNSPSAGAPADKHRKTMPWLAIVAVLIATAIQLRRQGRTWWCSCGRPNLWVGDVHSAHCSQHLLDPYSFTHVLHGLAFCGILAWALPKLLPNWRLFLAVAIESLWELLENSQLVIQRYRAATIALGYEGDSIVNSLSDVVFCAVGFVLARRLGLRRSIILFVLTELILLALIRDNLTLNVLMLV